MVIMKKFVFILMLPLLAFISCDNDDDDDRWVSIATVSNPDNSAHFSLKLDNNKTLYVSKTNFESYRPKTGQRVLVDYTVLDRKAETYNVKLNDAYNILTKGIFYITPETQDSIGNDPIAIRDIWVGSDFLNVEFLYWGYGKTHYINLVKDDSKQYADNKIHLEFRHNNNNDAQVYRYNGIVSFNLTSLLSQTSTPLELAIHIKKYNGEESVYNFEYNPQNASIKDMDDDSFQDNKNSQVE
jgi:hypothetical protein